MVRKRTAYNLIGLFPLIFIAAGLLAVVKGVKKMKKERSEMDGGRGSDEETNSKKK